MTRRRLPLRRTSSPSSPSPNRRNADTKNLVTAQVFGSPDITGYLRAILLGAFVGGLVIFLFYPDISSLMEHWQNSSEQSGGILRSARSEKNDVQDDSGSKLKFVDASKEEKNGVRAQPHRDNNERKVTKSEHEQKNQDQKDDAHSACPCPCQCRQPDPPPGKCQPPPSTPKTPKKTSVPKEDLMEEEEIVEEEDPVEVQLMEEEEPVVFTDLGSDDDTTRSETSNDGQPDTGKTETAKEEALSSKDVESNTHDEERVASRGDSQANTPSLTDKEEPLVLTDGQPITFTPVSAEDGHFIRVGGRPKPAKEANRESVAKSQTSPATKQNASAKSSQSSEKAKKNTATSSKPSQTKQDSGTKKKTASTKPSKKKEDLKNDDLPEEVRNFQPTFLKTVTAKKIFADGRRIPPVELLPQKETNSSVKVFLFNEFLSEAECDGLRRVHDKHVQEMASKPLLCFDSLTTLRKHLSDVKNDIRVTPKDFVQGTKCLNASFSRQLGSWMGGNWSYSTAFYPGESRFSTVFAGRVERAMGLEPANGGKFQITSYPTGKAYKAHTDCVLEGADPRDRVATVLVYLDDVQDGGETKFPELGIWVKPRKGRALVWNNMSPEGLCEPHSLHVASKVNSGSKYILIRWYYYKSFYSLGKRPPEPSLPTRDPGTPRVSCDDYDNGSCRWYDEWNNDHLLDYEYKKYTLI